MKQNKINRIVPSQSIVLDKLVDDRDKVIVSGSLIYKVSGSYSSSFTKTTSSYDPVSPPIGFSINKLNEMKDYDREKYYRDDDEIICEKIVKQKSNTYNNEYLIEASTNHSSSNHKYLKIWKYYWTDDEGWQPTKSGLVVPIKEAKSFIKDLHDNFSS
ncbi:MAG: hypothetical protein H8E71_06150 [Candidatus Marinimicrobia bacterium]|nr:hypothetical protein [Candidatus Neomarinimicrobiota bacterium]